MNIGLFGGTFNPIHLGHIDTVNQVYNALSLDKVLLIPAYVPPHKELEGMLSYDHRFNMTALAIQPYSHLEVNDAERSLPKPSYTLQTIRYFNKLLPNDVFYYMMGADAFNKIESWYHWQDLLTSVNIVVIDRHEYCLKLSDEVQSVFKKSPFAFIHLPLDTLPVSSTMVREAIHNKSNLSMFLTGDVISYIEKNNLYR